MKKQLLQRSLISLSALVFVWAVWGIGYLCVQNEYVLPSFSSAVVSFWALFTKGEFYVALGGTFLRTLYAFLGSVLVAVALALLAYLIKNVRTFLAPIVSVLRSVPTMALILILIVGTTPYEAPVWVTVLVLFPTAYASALASLDEVDPEWKEMAKAYKVPVGRQIVKMYLPVSAPSFLSEVGSLYSLGLKVTVSAEVLAKTAYSLGDMMYESKLGLETSELFALTIVVVLIGFLLEGAFALLNYYLTRWRRAS